MASSPRLPKLRLKTSTSVELGLAPLPPKASGKAATQSKASNRL